MENKDILLLELRKLGLNEKEAKVYLTALEMGHTTVQKLAEKVGMSRPTTYRVYESLEKRGLMEKTKQNARTHVVAQSPDELLGILRSEKRKIEEKEREFLRIISILQAKYYLDDKNEIKVYSGKEGKKLLLEDFSAFQQKDICVFIYSSNKESKRELSHIYGAMQKRLGKIEVKEIQQGKESSKPKSDFIKRKFVKKLPVSFPEIIIIADQVIFLDNEKCLQIEQKEVVNTFKSMFSLIWGSQ